MDGIVGCNDSGLSVEIFSLLFRNIFICDFGGKSADGEKTKCTKKQIPDQ